jgi:hypothetical protein
MDIYKVVQIFIGRYFNYGAFPYMFALTSSIASRTTAVNSTMVDW